MQLQIKKQTLLNKIASILLIITYYDSTSEPECLPTISEKKNTKHGHSMQKKNNVWISVSSRDEITLPLNY